MPFPPPPERVVRFYVGLHQPSDAQHFDRCFISVNRLRKRKGPFKVDRWIMDSGAFTELERHGTYRHGVGEYAAEVRRWAGNGRLERAVAQDWMCEPFMLAKTGLTVEEHQRLTIERYDALLDCELPVPVMPVLQGYAPEEYARHLEAYGERLTPGMWVGVGSVCKRNAKPESVCAVLDRIVRERPDLRLHGFGVKRTALLHSGVRSQLYSADSMAWSFSARKQGRNANDWREARAFSETVVRATALARSPWQMELI